MSKARDLADVVVPTGAVVGTTDSQTLSSKTITGLIADGAITEEVYTLTGTAIDPTNGTIQVNALSAPAALNASGGSYIFLAIA